MVLCGWFTACRDPGPDVDTSRPADFSFQTSVHTTLLEQGREAYATYCSGCHGLDGNGNGEAAKFFDPKPRNFQKAYFKFSSTRSGQLPTDGDLRRTIREGLKGSAMPTFELLPEQTVTALIEYIKTFSDKWQQREPAPMIPFVEDPYRSNPDKSAAIQRGKAVYHGYASCWTCHPSYISADEMNKYIVAFGGLAREAFRPDIHQSVGKENNEGALIYPPDFKRDFVRSGSDLEDLYRTIGAGITGTAMPTWIDSIDVPGDNPGDPPLVQKSDLWAMAYYVQDLILQRPPKLAEGAFVIRDRPRKIYLHGEPPEPEKTEEDDFWNDEFGEDEDEL